MPQIHKFREDAATQVFVALAQGQGFTPEMAQPIIQGLLHDAYARGLFIGGSESSPVVQQLRGQDTGVTVNARPRTPATPMVAPNPPAYQMPMYAPPRVNPAYPNQYPQPPAPPAPMYPQAEGYPPLPPGPRRPMVVPGQPLQDMPGSTAIPAPTNGHAPVPSGILPMQPLAQGGQAVQHIAPHAVPAQAPMLPDAPPSMTEAPGQ